MFLILMKSSKNQTEKDAEVARESGVRDTRFSSFDHALNRAAQSLRRTLTRAR